MIQISDSSNEDPLCPMRKETKTVFKAYERHNLDASAHESLLIQCQFNQSTNTSLSSILSEYS